MFRADIDKKCDVIKTGFLGGPLLVKRSSRLSWDDLRLNFDPFAMKFNYDYHDDTCTAIFTRKGFSLYIFFIDNDIHESIAVSAMLRFVIFHLRFCYGIKLSQ